jgi:hypothetical protein
MFRNALSSAVCTIVLIVALASCGQGPTGPGPGTQATLVISANLAGTAAATVVVDVTAPDIPTMLVFNIPVVNSVATGTITVPAGSNRTLTLRVFDAGGTETHSGSTTVNIAPGTNATMAITLTPLTGNLPINATLGSYVVTVTPNSANLSLSGSSTAQLSATIMDTQGHPTSGVVTWATNDPGVATVSAAGLVTATGTGTTSISAVFQGVTGTSAITVAP